MEVNTGEILTHLQKGKITVQGEFLWGSNYTFLAQVEYEGHTIQAVYKPTRGERPLWDFPIASLAKREVAAFLVSEALGWELVPPTVFRSKGPVGSGSLQFFVEHDPDYHYFNFSDEDLQRLRPTALFDLLINNADRKGSHILIDPQNHIWLIDHGVCFHVEEKLRTVIWDFAGESLPEELCAAMVAFRNQLAAETDDKSGLFTRLKSYLSTEEIRTMAGRAKNLIESNRFPPPNPYRRPYPWPQI